jgi:Rrf2 family nitric oxide-sensitive transcriptional repressor
MNSLIKREFDYAIRICAYLAGKKGQGPVSISQISQKLFITRPFATKIVYRLKQYKILNTTQGKEGGVSLNANPETLSVYNILEAIGFDGSINERLKVPGFCPLVKTCKIHSFFIGQEKILLQSFKNKMIQDFVILESDLIQNIRLAPKT